MLLRRLSRWAVLILVATHVNSLYAKPEINEKVILGWVEWIAVEPTGLPAKAKLDTGAKTSSLHARNIEWFEKGGQDWVRFQFSPNTKLSAKRMREGKSKNFVTIEAPIHRSTLIKQHKRASSERPVIMHKFILDGREYEAEFTLTDRSRFIYPVLLGRGFLQDVAIVDPSRTYLRTQPPAKKPDNRKKQAADKAADAKKPSQPKAPAKSTHPPAAEKSNTP